MPSRPNSRITAVGSVEFAGINNRPADAGSVTTDELGAAMDDDVDTIVNRLEQYRCGDGAVTNHGHTVFVSDVGYSLVLEDVVFGIANGFYIDQSSVIFDCFGKHISAFGASDASDIS